METDITPEGVQSADDGLTEIADDSAELTEESVPRDATHEIQSVPSNSQTAMILNDAGGMAAQSDSPNAPNSGSTMEDSRNAGDFVFSDSYFAEVAPSSSPPSPTPSGSSTSGVRPITPRGGVDALRLQCEALCAEEGAVLLRCQAALRCGRDVGGAVHIAGVVLVGRGKATEGRATLFWLPLTLLPLGSAILAEDDKLPESPRSVSPTKRNEEMKYALGLCVADVANVVVKEKRVALTCCSREERSAMSVALRCSSAEAAVSLEGLLRCLPQDVDGEEGEAWRKFLYTGSIKPTVLQDVRAAKRSVFGFFSKLASAATSSSTRPTTPPESFLAPTLPEPSQPRAAPLCLSEARRIQDQLVLKGAVFARGCAHEARHLCWSRIMEIDGVDREACLSEWATLLEVFSCKVGDQDVWACEQDREIEKDVLRTDRELPEFWDSESEGMELLRRMLRAYVLQHREVGYVQGMSDVASVACVVMGMDPVPAYTCFLSLMQLFGAKFENNSHADREALASLMSQLHPELYDHLQKVDPDNMYAFRWLFMGFKREFPMEGVLRVWDTILAAPIPHYELVMSAALLRALAPQMLPLHELSDMLKFCQDLSSVSVDSFLALSDSLWASLLACDEDPMPVLCLMLNVPLEE